MEDEHYDKPFIYVWYFGERGREAEDVPGRIALVTYDLHVWPVLTPAVSACTLFTLLVAIVQTVVAIRLVRS